MAQAAGPTLPCGNHIERSAEWRCPQCEKKLCRQCVRVFSAGESRFASCRACGGQCIELDLHGEAGTDSVEPSFHRRLPQAPLFPLREGGWATIVTGAVCLWIVGWLIDLVISIIPIAQGTGFLKLCVRVILWTPVLGYITAYMIEILGETARGVRQMPEWPSPEDLWDEAMRPLLLTLGAMIFCLGPAVAWSQAKGDEAGIVYGLLLVAGLLCLPMGLVAVVLFDSIAALNPLLMIRSFLRAPQDYLIVSAGMLAVYGLWIIADPTSRHVPLIGVPLRYALVLYCLAVEMHLLGMFYHANRFRLGWFEREPEPAPPGGGAPSGRRESDEAG